ncbi:MAG: hypothetical protein HZA46_00910 [Planctomycetales bacterium]|nr:hypothetical protein [Planctomycetales bacterium]
MRRCFSMWMGVVLLTALAPADDSLRAVADDETKTDPPPQVERDGTTSRDGQASPRERVNSSFDRTSPPLDEMIPDVAGYDANGKPIRLRELRGRHTVLVFGCLT